MPIYEYVCRACGNEEAVIQKVNEQPLTVCPKCGGEFRKKISAPSIRFKGDGFYITDYAKKSDNKSEKPSSIKNEGTNKAQKGSPNQGSPKKDTLAS